MSLKKSERISILRGGVSDEKEISILTANQVFKTLEKKYDTTIIEVGEDCNKFITDLKNSNPNKVFNCLHGFFGEDGQIQSFLNYLGIPYTHSGVLASSLAMNKILSKSFYESLGIKCPKTIEKKGALNNNSFPLIAKPICGGSSNGLVKIKNNNQLLNFKNKNSSDIFFEEYITGRELTVGILDNKICGIMEIIFEDELYDYKNKYVNIAKHLIDPPISSKIKKEICEISLTVHNKLNCNCLSRLDFRYNTISDEVFLLEVNTQPGLTENSLLPEMAKSKGISFLELCEIILSYARCE